MKRLLTLAPLIAVTLTSATSLASEPTAPNPNEAIVEKELLKPLAAKERAHSRFSRSRLPAQARRVRMVDTEPVKDEAGRAFVKFAVDARHGLDLDEPEDAAVGWRKDTMTGCVYPDSGAVFVLRGKVHYPAAILLGKKSKPAAATTCTAAPAEVAAAK